MPVRPFARDDIPQVADLNWRVLRGRKGPPPSRLTSFLQEAYFANPWLDGAQPSLVYETADGKVVGFLGVIARKMSLRGQSLRVAFGGNFVVEPEFRSTLAGLHLLTTYMAGGQDVSQTDSANDISRRLLERLGFRTIVPFSVHWARPLRPAGYAAYELSRFAGRRVSAALRFAAQPFCSVADRMAARLRFSPFRQAEAVLHASELDAETLLRCLTEFRGDYALWAEYDAHSLQWLLSFMERVQARGKLRKLVLRDDHGKVVGWYIYGVKPGAVGEVVQIGGERQSMQRILEHLFHDAWGQGVVALHGVVNSSLMDEFSDKNCFFTCRGGWMLAHSRRPEIIERLTRGDAFLSRLDGEWSMGFGR